MVASVISWRVSHIFSIRVPGSVLQEHPGNSHSEAVAGIEEATSPRTHRFRQFLIERGALAREQRGQSGVGSTPTAACTVAPEGASGSPGM
jgi:hypothetical protein